MEEDGTMKLQYWFFTSVYSLLSKGSRRSGGQRVTEDDGNPWGFHITHPRRTNEHWTSELLLPPLEALFILDKKKDSQVYICFPNTNACNDDT